MSSQRPVIAGCLTLFAVLVPSRPLQADLYGGIEFPQGASSFADSVLRYDPLYQGGPAPTDPGALDPTKALGPPDFAGPGIPRIVSLGHGGLLELSFVDNLLTNSGNSVRDLHVFEVGADVEDTFVAVRPTPATMLLLNPAMDANSDGFYEIGEVFGSTSSIDIDALFPGFLAGTLRFDAVQLIDDRLEGGATGSTVGADIDAVGAITSTAAIPEPSAVIAWSLLGMSAAACKLRRSTRSAATKG